MQTLKQLFGLFLRANTEQLKGHFSRNLHSTQIYTDHTKAAQPHSQSYYLTALRSNQAAPFKQCFQFFNDSIDMRSVAADAPRFHTKKSLSLSRPQQYSAHNGLYVWHDNAGQEWDQSCRCNAIIDQ